MTTDHMAWLASLKKKSSLLKKTWNYFSVFLSSRVIYESPIKDSHDKGAKNRAMETAKINKGMKLKNIHMLK